MRAAMPPIEKPNRFYTDDLIGMGVFDEKGIFGTVHSVANYGAGDILEILRPKGVKEVYAFTDRTFPVVDTAARRITIDPPDILGLDRKEQE